MTGSNAYTNAGAYNTAPQLCFGTVLATAQSAHHYHVAVSEGGPAILAVYFGGGGGQLGASEGGGPLPGERVVLLKSVTSGGPAVILSRLGLPVAGTYRPPNGLLVHPQVCGFDYGERMSGAMYRQRRGVQNYNPGVLDALDGEWLRHSMMGAGVGVELFRAFLTAGPFCGVYGYTEDQHLRLIGAKMERVTLSGSEYDGASPEGLVRLAELYYYALDRLSSALPQAMDIDGLIAGGRQHVNTYPDRLNQEPVQGEDDEAEGRIALIHEHRGLDGTYVLSAANSLTLQKTLDIPFPFRVVEPDEDEEEETECRCAPCELTPDPEWSPPGAQSADDANVGALRFSSTRVNNPLAIAMNARGMADQAVLDIALGGFKASDRWGIGARPTRLFGGRTPKQLLFNPSPAMWKSVPQTIKIALTPDGSAKRFYFGRAMISITEDGGIVLQEAGGAQILLSGGNVVVSAPHDVANVAGRNRIDIAGRDSVVRAQRHAEISAAEGRFSAVAAAQVTVLGGLNGRDGVLIESKGGHAGTNETGENPAASGAVVIMAKHMVGVEASHVYVRAKPHPGWNNTGVISLDAQRHIEWHTRDDNASGAFAANTVLPGLITSSRQTTILQNLWVDNYLTIHKMLRRRSGANPVPYVHEGHQSRLLSSRGRILSSAILALTMGRAFAAKWLTSQQYNLDSANFFTLPEPEWQARARASVPAGSALLTSFMADTPLDNTHPLPGKEAWTGFGMGRINTDDSDEWGVGPEISLALESVGLQNGLLRGI